MKATMITDENGYHEVKVKFDPYQDDDEAGHTEHLTVRLAGGWTFWIYPNGQMIVDAIPGKTWSIDVKALVMPNDTAPDPVRSMS